MGRDCFIPGYNQTSKVPEWESIGKVPRGDTSLGSTPGGKTSGVAEVHVAFALHSCMQHC